MQNTKTVDSEHAREGALAWTDDSINEETVETLLAQNTALREAMYEAAKNHPSETMRQRLLLQASRHAPAYEVARMRVRVLGELRFPRHLRKMWSATEVEEWLENETIRLAGGGIESSSSPD